MYANAPASRKTLRYTKQPKHQHFHRFLNTTAMQSKEIKQSGIYMPSTAKGHRPPGTWTVVDEQLTVRYNDTTQRSRPELQLLVKIAKINNTNGTGSPPRLTDHMDPLKIVCLRLMSHNPFCRLLLS